MVKNTTGGTKTKGLARKHVSSASSSAIRLPESALEQIVVVSKMLGNGMCEVFNNEDQRFIAHIRNKFKGRNRRSNDISANSFILIGIRDWEKPYKNVDVIFVYEPNDYLHFKSFPSILINNLLIRTNNASFHDSSIDMPVIFDDAHTPSVPLAQTPGASNPSASFSCALIDFTDI